jgi:hypothetical protein
MATETNTPDTVSYADEDGHELTVDGGAYTVAFRSAIRDEQTWVTTELDREQVRSLIGYLWVWLVADSTDATDTAAVEGN